MQGSFPARRRHSALAFIATLIVVATAGVATMTAAASQRRSGTDQRPRASIMAPLPPARPADLRIDTPREPLGQPEPGGGPAAPQGCLKEFEARGGEALPAQPSEANGDCAVAEPVTFQRVKLPDGSVVALESAVTVRCSLALELAGWIRDDLAPIAAKEGSALVRLNGVGGQACRMRNRQPGGQLSEHASGNAFDLQALTLADRRVIRLASPDAETKAARDQIKVAACARFRTVLGPGSDSFHGDHLHVDMRPRKRDFKLCQWDVK